ncbi:tRNA ligase subunit PheS family protein [Streptosporangium jomthongense]
MMIAATGGRVPAPHTGTASPYVSCAPPGARHPVTVMSERIVDVFADLGYRVADGPEVEAEWFAFDALNMDKGHFARDRDHTFYVADPSDNGRGCGLVLRGHTSPVQIRRMLSSPPPIRMICTGRVFRPDPPDATHSPVFTQAEGLVVDRGLTMADLAGTLDHFASAVFGHGVVTRLRPHWFAYTEPSAEIDVVCAVCRGVPERACRTCSGAGWVEWGGCGMVHPRVLATCGVDPAEYGGFAFGVGVERTLMLKHGLDDIRALGETPLPEEPPGPSRPRTVRRAAGRALASAGYVETVTSPFVGTAAWDALGLAADDPRRRTLTLVNPLDAGEPELRTTLLPGLLGALRRDVARGRTNLGLFEQGTVFTSPVLMARAPRVPTGARPGEADLRALRDLVPAQPYHLAAALAGEPRWAELVDAARTVAGASGDGLRLTTREGGPPPWLPGRCVALLAGPTVLGHAGQLSPDTVGAMDLPPGTSAMELDLDILERLTTPNSDDLREGERP